MATGTPADDAFLHKLHNIIQAKMSDSEFGVNELAHEMGMSRSNLHRRVREITGKTVVALISEARLKKAMELLREQTYTVSEVSWKAGFGSATYFDKCFRDHFGFPPGEAAKHGFSENLKDENKEAENQTKSNKKKILVGGISLLVLVSVLLVFVFLNPFAEKTENLPKTIAVLPFYNDSQDSSNVYVINGIMDGIITNLSKIEDLFILPRSSVEFYRKNRPKSNQQIARELDVAYIVDGSGQKTGEQLKITINLIEGETNKLLVSEKFFKSGEEILDLESEIALLIANTIDANITPDETNRIEKRPTNNIAAYNLVLKAGEIDKVNQSGSNKILSQQAENYLKEAIRLDSTFSGAYVALGWKIGLSKENHDTALILADRALHFDSKNAYAHALKGWIYNFYTHPLKLKEAEEEYKLAVKFSNGLTGISGLGDLYYIKGEYLKSIEYKLKALKYNRSPDSKKVVLGTICGYTTSMGLIEEALRIAYKLTEPNEDSVLFFSCLYYKAIQKTDFQTALKINEKTSNHDSELLKYRKLTICLWLKDYKSALKQVEDYYELLHNQGKETTANFLAGYVYLKNGDKKKADFHLKGALYNQLKYIKELGQNVNQKHYLYLAGIYSVIENREMALKALDKAKKCEEMDNNVFEVANLKHNPIYETIANEPEFQKYISNVENRFNETQTKVRELLKKESKLLGVD